MKLASRDREVFFLSYSAECRVNFFDTDAMGVVHHANYVRWFEVGRVHYLREAGVVLTDMMADGIMFPITEVRAKYLSPARYDDVLLVETTAKALTKAKMEFNFRVLRKETGEVLVTGYTQNVYTSEETGKIVRLPDKYYLKLKAAMDAEQG